jgi:hypothetical protein
MAKPGCVFHSRELSMSFLQRQGSSPRQRCTTGVEATLVVAELQAVHSRPTSLPLVLIGSIMRRVLSWFIHAEHSTAHRPYDKLGLGDAALIADIIVRLRYNDLLHNDNLDIAYIIDRPTSTSFLF